MACGVYIFSLFFVASCILAQQNTQKGDLQLDNLLTNLWNTDKNRLDVGKELLVNWQSKVQYQGGVVDQSAKPFCAIKSTKISVSPSYKTFIALLDNYDSRIGYTEQVTSQETQEINAFLDAVLATNTMKEIHKYLVSQKLSMPSPTAFKKQLYDIWFQMFARKRKDDSSAFEHTFIGETKIPDKTVLGAHYWLTFCMKEQAGKVNYHGHFLSRHNDPPFKATIRFDENKQYLKALGSMLLGSSIEFEFGLLTVAYLKSIQQSVGQSNWKPFPVKIAGYNILIQCHPFKGFMGSCYLK